MKTSELLEKLAKRFPKPSYVFLPGVRNSTGFPNSIRTADAIAMSLWPSRGLHLHGFELKTSRNDWLNELKNPEKAEEISQYCDYWWLVISDPDILEKGELPPTWGLMAAIGRGKSIKVIKEASQRKDVIMPPWFLASILRSATEGMIPEATISNEIEDAKESQKQIDSYEIKRLTEERDDALKVIDEFNRITGLDLSKYPGWFNEELLKAIKDARNGKYKTANQAMQKIKLSALKIAKFIDDEIQSYQI